MNEVPPMSSRNLTIAALALASLLACAPRARSEERSAESSPRGAAVAGDVRIVITKVRATRDPDAKAGAPRQIDAALQHLPIEKLDYDYTSYQLEQRVERVVKWKEPVSISLGDGGSYEVVAQPSRKDGHVLVSVTERAPRADKPCLQIVGHEVPAGKVGLWFCNLSADDGTHLFFVTTEPAQ
jgi:hypothetical protein